MKNEDWRLKAQCLGKITKLFFPEPSAKGSKKQTNDMKAFCKICTVIDDCLTYSLTNNEQFGIWGGLSTGERNRIFGPKGNDNINVKEVRMIMVKKNVKYKV